MCDCLSRTNDVMSLANVTYFISFPSTLILFIRTLLRIKIDNSLKDYDKKKNLLLLMLS